MKHDSHNPTTLTLNVKITPTLLDTLLSPLVRKKDSERAYELSRSVVKQCVSNLRKPIAMLVNSFLVGGDQALIGQDEEDANMGELKGEVHELIYELNRVEQALLLTILPHLQGQLELDDFEVRYQAIGLIGRIVGESKDAFLQDNQLIVSAFMSRIFDKDAKIRQVIMKFLSLLLQRGTSGVLHLVLSNQLGDRNIIEHALGDPDTDVRLAGIRVVKELLQTTGCEHTSEALLQAVAQRLLDRVPKVSEQALECLVLAFRTQLVDEFWRANTSVPKDRASLLAWIPSSVVLAGQRQPKLRETVVHAVNTGLFGEGASVEEHIEDVLRFYTLLSPSARSFVNSLVGDRRAGCRRFVKQALDMRTKDLSKAKALLRTVEEEYLAGSGKPALAAILDKKDGHVFKHMMVLVVSRGCWDVWGSLVC